MGNETFYGDGPTEKKNFIGQEKQKQRHKSPHYKILERMCSPPLK